MPISSDAASLFRRSSARGFALLIVVTLLAFLVLLLVSLASLTRVETQVADNNQKSALARQNALLALNIALGKLQQFTGPDQRVTAPADLIADHDSAGAPTSAPAGIAVQTSTRRWTGVWGNESLAIGYTLTPTQIIGRGTTPRLLNWLVSGNEAAAVSITSANGRITVVTPPRFTPATPLAGVSADFSTADSQRPAFTTDAGPVPGVLLVGPRATSDGSTTDAAASLARGDFVVVPLVELRTSATDPVLSRYAWWIGDEGVKARINLHNGYQKTGLTSDRLNSFITAQRTAPEFADAASPGTTLNLAYDFNQPGIPLILQIAQLPLAGTGTAATTSLTLATRRRFHDFTPHSVALLADSYAGGLKKDLTADIADTTANSTYRPADATPLFKPLLLPANQAGLPTWGHLRSWARTRPPLGDPGKVSPTVPTATEAGVYPIITYASLGLNYYLQDPNDTLKVALYPLVVLCNPYPFTLKATDYDFAIRVGVRGKINIQVDNTTVAVFDTTTTAITPPSPTPAPPASYFRFRIKGSDLPPGESHIYLLPDTAHAAAYDPLAPALLGRAPDDDAIGETNFVTLTGPALGPLTATSTIRLTTSDLRVFQSELGFVLARDGALLTGSGTLAPWAPATADGWYQAMINSLSGSHALVAATVCDLAAEGSLVSARRALGTTPPITEAQSALRLGAVFQGHHFWSTSARMGIPYIDRTLAVGSHRAPLIQPTKFENVDPDEGRKRTGSVVLGATLGGPTDGRPPHLFFINERYAANFGFWLDADSNQSGLNALHHSILYDLLDSPDRLLSLGQLQNAPFSRYSFYPTYAFGNSYAAVRVPRDANHIATIVKPPGGTTSTDPVYDLSWHLNRSLWDRYFVSGIPSTLNAAAITTAEPLPNARLTYVHRNGAAPALDSLRYNGGATNPAYDEAAAHLVVAGGFNINSTSEQAWRAILGGTRGLPEDPAYAEPGDSVNEIIPYPRFTHNPARVVQSDGPYQPLAQSMVTEGTYNQVNFNKTLYLGNRGLYLNASAVSENPSAQAVVAELARSIVAEIRQRGPFLSLGDFINRPVTAPANPLGIKGVLQAGLDGMNPSVAQANPYHWLSVFPYKGLSHGSGFGFYPGWDEEHSLGGPVADKDTGRDTYRSRFAMAPKFLTQADLLSTLGPQLTARADTFTIRAYGEALNPATSEIEGRAWCEAVVQRTPDYVAPSATQQPHHAASGLNATLGRRYVIVSFRWLTPEDL